MQTLVPPTPTPAGFAQLADILSSLADGRAALGDALVSVTGTDAGLYAAAARLRRKAATPQKFWHFVTAIQGMSAQAGTDHAFTLPQPSVAEGLYGAEIFAAASSLQAAADGCLAARDAQLMASRAGKDLALWLAQHGASNSTVLMTANLDEWEAEHLACWARLLSPEATPNLA